MLISVSDNLDNAVAEAACVLRAGHLVAFPTETVYGLGASAWKADAVARIFAAKGRPADNPLIVHIAGVDMLHQVVRVVPPIAQKLITAFWPGPLSLILPKQPRVPGIVTGGLDSVAVRWPNHPVAESLIRQAAMPIAAPSANRSGRPSPTLAQHVKDDLADQVDLILDAGMATIGLESTVLDLTKPTPMLLRPGSVTLEDLRLAIGEVDICDERQHDQQAPLSPGLKYTHYAPDAPLYLFLGQDESVKDAMLCRLHKLQTEGKRVGILTFSELQNEFSRAVVYSLGPLHDYEQAASRLYSALRDFDEQSVDVILAHGPASHKGLGRALLNRLSKASGYRLVWV